MKRWAIFTICCLGILQLGAEGMVDRLRRLEAENRFLLSQIASLKKKLAAGEDRGPVSRPTQPAAKPHQKKGMTRIVLTLHERPDTLLADSALLARELSIRAALRSIQPAEAPDKWLTRHGNLIGRKVKWATVLGHQIVVDEHSAERNFFIARGQRDTAKIQLKTAIRNRSSERQQDEYRAEIGRAEARMEYWQMLMEAKGGMVLECEPKTRDKAPFAAKAILLGRRKDSYKRGMAIRVCGTIRKVTYDSYYRPHFVVLLD